MFRQTGGESEREGLFSALKNILVTLLSIGKTRAELLVTEIEEEKYRLLGLAGKALAAAFLLALAAIMVVMAVAAAFWEQRIVVFTGFALLFAGVSWGLINAIRLAARQPSKLFRASLSELETDMTQLQRRGGEKE